MIAELYKAGIIEIDLDIDSDESEMLWNITVHFEGDIFTPNLVRE